MRREWTPEEDARLIKIANDDSHEMSAKEIGLLFRRSTASVKHRAARLGCSRLGHARVVAYGEDIVSEVLRLNSAGHTVKEIAVMVPAVEIGSISRMVRSSGSKTNDPQEWNVEEIEWLRANYATLGSRACGKYLGVTRSAIAKLARKRGIVKGKRKGIKRVFDEAAICKAYETAKSLKEVAIIFKTTYNMISTILKRNGVEVKLYSRFREYQDAIVRDYQTGTIPTQEIAARYNLSDDRVREGLRGLGLHDPSRHGRFANRKSPHDCWVERYGEEEAAKRSKQRDQRASDKLKGIGNGMYNKPSPQGAGNGWKGWYRDHYFRSLREVMFMIDADAKGVAWLPGEKGHSIRYRFNDAERTYRPDFIVGNVMYELKPVRLHETPNVLAKKVAAEAYCAARDMEYRLVDQVVDKTVIKEALDRGNIRFAGDYLERFLAYAA